MSDIKLKIKLAAYTKLPLDKYITDVPEVEGDENVYGRKHGEWVVIPKTPGGHESDIILADNSGLNLVDVDETHRALSIRQVICEEEPETWADDTTYYIVENTPELFINGGTAFSDGNNDYIIEQEYEFNYKGGAASTFIILPLNAQGVYSGN